jgi:hypothetical protein
MCHTREHTSRRRTAIQASLEKAAETCSNVLRPPLLVWGRVVSDIPAFCRELVAALAE